MSIDPGLEYLATLYDIETSYDDIRGQRHHASHESLIKILQSLGAPIHSPADIADALTVRERALWQQSCEPVRVIQGQEPPALTLRVPADANGAYRVEIVLEQDDSEVYTGRLSDLPITVTHDVAGQTCVERAIRLEHPLPLGYHRARIDIGRDPSDTLLLCPPKQAWQPKDRTWGVFAPLYALHSQRSMGGGDLGDLDTLVSWVGRQGGSVVGTLPLLPTFLDVPCDPSPYTPVSRLFWNEFYLDLEKLAETSVLARTVLASSEFRNEADALRREPLVDYRRQMALKRRLLEKLAQDVFTQKGTELQALEAFVKSNPRVRDYAEFRAATEQAGQPWPAWPTGPRSGTLRPSDYQEEAVRYHLYVQWKSFEQMESLAEKGRSLGVGLYLDLPLGVHQGGYDAWRERDAFLFGCALGAPPDAVFTEGQCWGITPLHPVGLRRQSYRYFIDCIRHHLKSAGALRIDHVMGLHRVYCVPEGMSPKEGVYVRYRYPELYAILAIESNRAGAFLVGEDLGTVPDIVRTTMAQTGIHRMHVLEYELEEARRDPFVGVPNDAVASVNTHDMPPFVRWWDGSEIDDRVARGFVTADEAVHLETERCRAKEIVTKRLMARPGEPTQMTDPFQNLSGILMQYAGSSAAALLVNLEDLWLEREPQNVPATGHERPNWRRKFRHTLETIMEMPEVGRLLQQIDNERKAHANEMVVDETTSQGGDASKRPDPPSESLLTDMDIYLFNEGTHCQLYDKFGAHPHIVGGKPGIYFAVWAPNAAYVSVMGDFNGWDRGKHPLAPRGSSGIWEGFVPDATVGQLYKYHIAARDSDYTVDKADPFGFAHELPPKTGSAITDLTYAWGDSVWLKNRASKNRLDAPMAIYEVHLGSWMRVSEEGGRSLTYRELATTLVDYVTKMGFTHVEFLPVMEHPFFGSWGYQVTGYFAPSSRYGSVHDLMVLIDRLHQAGIGVIFDWAPAHFPADEHGLGYFDGTHLYEHADPRQRIHPDWQSLIFNYDRNEVRSFLSSSAIFWLHRYHLDGLRVDGVASMLYLDYSRKSGEWIPNQYGGRENLGAIQLIRHLNRAVYARYPDVQTIAEESTSWPMVSRPTDMGGLGFGLKWDMGFMHDTLRYMGRDPIHRRFHHNALTFRSLYAFYENFVLPLSHDEVVHGKGSLLGKMPGDVWQKFANLRLLYGYMYGLPGKKMLFMGSEIAQWGEWQHDGSVEWHLEAYERHRGVQELVKQLNRVYRETPALHTSDCNANGFEWIDADNAEQCVLTWLRQSRNREETVLVVCNFTPTPQYNFRIGVDHWGVWQEILNTDADLFGGSGHGNLGQVDASPVQWHGRPFSLCLTLPPLGVLFLKAPTKALNGVVG